MTQSLIGVFRQLKKHFGPQHWWPADTPFEVVVGAILTQNTSWSNVEKAIQNLKREKLLSVRAMSNARPKVLANAIRPAGTFNIKAKRLAHFVHYLNEGYSGKLGKFFKQKLPQLREELLNIHGIGPETADSIILYAAQKPIFVVDAYTRRILSRLGLTPEKADYHHIQQTFMSRLPHRTELFNEYHALLVEHAKRLCRKVPRCHECPLRPDCPYGRHY